jgi:hypothetical protein
MSKLDANLASNPVSPKVSVPFILLFLGNLAEVAATQDWSQENTLVAILTLVQVAVGYWINDPNRV